MPPTGLTQKNHKMEVQVKTAGLLAHLLAQSQQKLQLNYKTTITQNHWKIEPNGSPTTKELKKSHPFRWVGGAEKWTRGTRGVLAFTHM